jgi:alpha-galactosidase
VIRGELAAVRGYNLRMNHFGAGVLAVLLAFLDAGVAAVPAAPRAAPGAALGAAPRAAACAAPRAAARGDVPGIALEALDLGCMLQDWGRPQAARSVDGGPLRLNGQVHAGGVGTHAGSELDIALDGLATRFSAWVGVDDESGTRGSVRFAVLVDDSEVERTEILRGGDAARHLSVDLRGAQLLTLLVEDAGDGIDHDHADWADARIEVLPGIPPTGGESGPGDSAARIRSVPPPADAPLDIVRPESPLPAIHGPRVVGTTPGRPFLYRIPATGSGPLRFAARGLPDGLALERWTGLITGSLAHAGEHDVTLEVVGAHGRSERGLRIVGGGHRLALTPPLGWNSWNAWGTAVDDARVRAAADALLSSGLAAHGFRYVNIDDGWAAGRDADGAVRTAPGFPDMRALGDDLHARGLLLGIYSSPGPRTCAGLEGSLGHEAQDALTWAGWGVDYLKHDWCSYGEIARGDGREELRRPYDTMRAALDAAPRDIVYSLCQYGMGEVWTWGAEAGGNLWRTTGDITDTWASMSGIGFTQGELSRFAGPGRWNDPDMLVVGRVGWGPELRNSRLTPNEQITHVTLWSLLAAPLLVGCDLTALDAFTRALLTNDDVLDVDQDPLGIAATRVCFDAAARTEVWARPLHDGALAVGLFNRGRRSATVGVSLAQLGRTGPQPVRNAWLARDEGPCSDGLSVEVPRHGAQLLIVGRAPAAP